MPLISTLADLGLGVSRLAKKATLLELCYAGRPSARVDKVWREVATLQDDLREHEEALRAHRAQAHSETSTPAARGAREVSFVSSRACLSEVRWSQGDSNP